VRCTSRIYAHLCFAKNSSYLMCAEGVDTLWSVRNSNVCVRIIVGDLANVTLTIFHDQDRDGTMWKEGQRLKVGIEGKSGECRQQPRLI